MSTGNRKVNIFLKKFLTQQQITENFLDYLHNLILQTQSKLVPSAGLYTYPTTVRSDVVDTISFLTPGEINPGDSNGPQLEGDDGHGRILQLGDILRTNIPVPNENGVKYYCGMRFNYYPTETEINVRTGKIKWGIYQESIGERAEPDNVSYYNNLLTVQVDSVCSGVSQIGRTVRVWLKEPVSQATGDVYEDVIVSSQTITFEHDGGLNFFDVPNEMKDYFTLGQSLTIDMTPSSPTTTTVTLVGAEDSGGTGFTRISVVDNLTAYTVANSAFVSTGNNVISLVGTLGQGTNPTVTASDYEVFLYGITVSINDLRNDEYYAYLCNYTGTGSGNNPSLFDISDQIKIPPDLGGIVGELEEFKNYQIQRNAFILRGGGQFSFDSGTLTWSDAFQVVNPFRGLSEITAGSMGSIVNDDVLYTKIYKEQPVVINGNASGEIWVEETTDFNNGDAVIVGDSDSNRIEGFVNGVPGIEKLTIVDGGLSPIDLSSFTTLKGAWVQRTNTSLYKAQINEGELRPDEFGKIDTSINVIAVVQNNVLIFKNGVLRLEDGDVGEISNLPSGFNWINTNDELTNSVVKSADYNVGVLAPKSYTLSAKLDFDKSLSWVGLTEETSVVGNLADPLIEIGADSTVSGSYQSVEFKNLTLQNSGAGDVIKIDNTGATKGIEVIIDSCILLGNGGNAINVIHGEASQFIRVHIRDSRNTMWQGSIIFESQNNGDEFIMNDIQLSPTNTITIGKAGTDPLSTFKITNSKVDQVNAIGSGTNKTIELVDTYSWEDHKRVDLNGTSSATFSQSAVIVELNDFRNYQKADNGVIFKGGGKIEFLGGTLTWDSDFHIVDPFYGIALIAPNALASIANNDIIYTRLYHHHFAVVDGNASGEIQVKDISDFNDNDLVIIGDEDSPIMTGYVFGSPSGQTITVDDGAGTPLDLSIFTVAKGAWIRRLNLSLLKGDINTSDLKPDYLGNIDPDIYIIGICNGDKIILKNGEVYEKKWVYEETIITDSIYNIDDEIYLPADSRDGNSTRNYQVGRGALEVFVNGVQWQRDRVAIESTITPTSYTSGTGVVLVPDSVDLSRVRIEDIFIDASSNEFSIIGNIDNTPGQKQFRIATGQVVDTGAGASIIRVDYEEYGAVDTWQTRIITRKKIPINAAITFRLIPIDKVGSASGTGGGGGGGSLQDAYNSGATVTVVSGNPIVISGPSGEKLLRVIGDIEVTGVIDPKGLTFTPQAVNPFTTSDKGIWLQNTGELKYWDGDTEQDTLIGGTSDPTLKSYTNPLPGSLLAGRVVTKSGTGQIQYADWNTDAGSRALGILLTDVTQNQSGNVKLMGYVASGIIGTDDFIEGVLPSDRSRVWLASNGQMTVTPPSQGSGKWQVIMGIWDDGGLHLQITMLGVA